jgi:hypothetical protein
VRFQQHLARVLLIFARRQYNRKSSIMKKAVIIGSILALSLVGCSTTNVQNTGPTSTQVDLSRRNYRIVKANAIGSSGGFRLLGILPFANPSYAEAMTRLYAAAGQTEGRSLAVINVHEERTGIYLILFYLPSLTVRGDIIEWQDERPTTPADTPPAPAKP